MALREIVIWPDPVLTQRAKPVGDEEFGPELSTLLEDMIETMYEADGLGLAAPQIGLSKCIFVVDVPIAPMNSEDGDPESIESSQRDQDADGDAYEERRPRTGPLVFINPEFVLKEGEILFEEGCLSLPDLTVEVKRAKRVVVRAKDAKGELFEQKAEGLFAIALQHEYDHLTGNLLVERLSPLKRQLARKRFLKLKSEMASEASEV